MKEAEDFLDALHFFTKAGSNSLNNYLNKEAITFFKEAVQLLSKLNIANTLEVHLTHPIFSEFSMKLMECFYCETSSSHTLCVDIV